MEDKLVWKKSARSGAAGHCVELAVDGDTTYIRDSKDPNGPKLAFNPAEMAAFIGGVKDGEFDQP